MTQHRQDPAGDDLHAHLRLGLILRLAGPRGHDRRTEMGRQHLVGRVEIRIGIARHADGTLEAIRYHQLRHTAKELESALVAHHPVIELLGAGGLGKGVVGGPQHGDKDLGPVKDLAGMRIDNGHGLAAVVDKEFFARNMGLPHRGLQQGRPLFIEPTEVVVAVVGARMALGVLLP